MSNQYENNPYDNGNPPQSQPSAAQPYASNPYTQPSADNPYEQRGGPYEQYEQPGGQYGQPTPYGQPAPYNQPTPYGQPYGAYGTLPEHPQGTLVLILGILGIFFLIPAPIAWVMGNKAKKEIDASGARYSNEQLLNVGRVLGMVFTILYAISIVLTVVGLVVLVAAAGAGS